MYTIRFNEDKSLRQTEKRTIYQYEDNVDSLLFLLPQTYEDVIFKDCNVKLRYILPNEVGSEENLIRLTNEYKGYLQYVYPIKLKFTELKGEIELWLSITNMEDEEVLKTGSTFIRIYKQKDIADYLDTKEYDQLDRLERNIANISENMVKNLAYNNETGDLNLVGDNGIIGDVVRIGGSGSGIYKYDNKESFPESGNINSLYIDAENDVLYSWNENDNKYHIVGINIYNLTSISGGDSNGEN